MRFLSILLLFFIFASSSYAQREIKLDELKDHIGDSVKVRGKVYGIRYLQNSKNAPTFINVGAMYPNQSLTVVVWDDVRKKLTYDLSDKKFAQGFAVVTGKVELYKDKPQIVIRDSKQLVFIYDEEVPADKIPPIEKKKDD
jgi:DNA/RNA endonuclease YhcR with UshA esterase domain